MKMKKKKRKIKKQARTATAAEEQEIKKALKQYAEFGLYSYILKKNRAEKAHIPFSAYVDRKTKKITTRVVLKEKYRKKFRVVKVYYDLETKDYILKPKKSDLSRPYLIQKPALKDRKGNIYYLIYEKHVDKRKTVMKDFYYNRYFGTITPKKIKNIKLSEKELKKIRKDYVPKSNVKNKKLISKVIENINKQSKRNIERQKQYIRKRYELEKKTTKDVKIYSKINVKIDLIRHTEDTPQLVMIYSNHEEVTDPRNIPTFNEMLMKMQPYDIQQLKKIVNREYADGYRVSYAYGYYVVYDTKTKMLYRKPIVFNPMMFF